jgi:hypothetical protein
VLVRGAANGPACGAAIGTMPVRRHPGRSQLVCSTRPIPTIPLRYIVFRKQMENPDCIVSGRTIGTDTLRILLMLHYNTIRPQSGLGNARRLCKLMLSQTGSNQPRTLLIGG